MNSILTDGCELSVEQTGLVNFDTDSNLVVVGGPGTGKTVLSVLRAQQIIEEDESAEVLILVYNRPLMHLLQHYVSKLGIPRCEVSTLHMWLDEFYKKYKGKKYPRISRRSADEFNPNWDRIIIDCKQLKQKHGYVYNHIIVDEAQDLPIELATISNSLAPSATFFFDPNQTILENISNHLALLLEELMVEVPYILTKNFRNTKEINAVGTLFQNISSKVRCNRTGVKPILIKVNNYDEQTKEIKDIVLKNPGKSIGIITTKASMTRTINELASILPDDISVGYYKSITDDTLNFHTKGVKFVSYGTMKGLEFDIVILPRFESVRSKEDEYIDRNIAHVAITRAKSELYIIYHSNKCTPRNIDTFTLINNHQELLDWR